MQSGGKPFLGSLNISPGVTNPLRVSLVIRLDATPGHFQCVRPLSSPKLRQRERQVEFARAEAAAQQREKDSSSKAPGRGGTARPPVVAPAPATRAAANRPVRPATPGVQSLPGNSQASPPGLWGAVRPLIRLDAALTPYPLPRLTVGLASNNPASRQPGHFPRSPVGCCRYQQAATAQQDFFNQDDGALGSGAAGEQR